MPFEINIYPEKEFGYVAASEDISVLESVEAVADLCRHPDFQSHFGVIVDFLRVQSTPAMKELRLVAAAIKQYKGMFHSRIALIVESKEVRKASIVCMLVRAFGVHMEAYGDFESALRYIKLGEVWTK